MSKNFKAAAVYCDGISTFTQNSPIYVEIDTGNNKIIFNQRFSKVPEASLSLDKIINADWVTEKDVRDSSVVGSAIVGGLLLGGLGAVVGAISGTKKKSDTFFVINYSSDGETKAVSIKPQPGDFKIFKLKDELKKFSKVQPGALIL